MKKALKIILCLILVFVTCFSLVACGKENTVSEVEEPFGGDYYNTIGSGRRWFYFYFVDNFDHRQNFCIATDALYLFDAFRENNMITSPAGETVTHFAGCQADEGNGYKWVLYADGKAVEGNYEEIKLDPKVTYSFIAEQIK